MHRSNKNILIFLVSFLVTGLLILAADRWAEGAESTSTVTTAAAPVATTPAAAPVQESSPVKSDSANIVVGYSTALARHYQTGAPIAAAPVQHPCKTRPCSVALSVCSRSCSERGGLYTFSCMAPEFQPFSRHEKCVCADEVR